MKKEMRLPQNGKEGLLYGSIICIITVMIMSTMNIRLQFDEFNKSVWLIILKALPLMFVIAMLIECFVVGRIAEKLVDKFSDPTDGFNARILFNIVFCVLGMSVCMTIIGDVMGHGISLDLFKRFPMNWPRNFCVAFGVEILIAQPTARFAMKMIHRSSKESICID